MVKDLTSEKKANKEAITKAIISLKQHGRDFGRHLGVSSISTEFLTRNLEFLKLLAEARGGRRNGNESTASAARPQAESPDKDGRLRELEAYNGTLRQRIQQMQSEMTKMRAELRMPHPLDASLHEELSNLQSENTYLREQLMKLKEEVQSASKSVNIAWQQGYLAGQHAAAAEIASQQTAPQKNFMETLAEAAQAATTYGTAEEEAVATATATTTQTEQTYYEEPAYIAEALEIVADPEVLSDPFTAKLLDALGVDLDGSLIQPDTVAAPPSPDEPEEQVDQYGQYGDPHVELEPEQHICSEHRPPEMQPHVEFEDVSVDQHAHDPGNGSESNPAPTHNSVNQFNCQPDGMIDQTETVVDQKAFERAINPMDLDLSDQSDTISRQINFQDGAPSYDDSAEDQDGELDDDTTKTFTADELHTLFRNKYVREDDLEGKDPAASGTFPALKKRFVGTNKAVSAEPAPAMSRAFPPEIRKACKLLGLNPEELTRPVVTEAWKAQMAKPGVHPDTGGDTEIAIYLNTAKDTLMRWIDDQTPKLGKKFGSQTREQPKPQQNKQE